MPESEFTGIRSVPCHFYAFLIRQAIRLFFILNEVYVLDCKGGCRCVDVGGSFGVDEGAIGDGDVVDAVEPFKAGGFDCCLCSTADDVGDVDVGKLRNLSLIHI